MSDVISGLKPNFNKVIEHLKTEVNSLRVGRATPSLVENIQVDSYGTKTPLVHLASISTLDPKTISIQPWDKNLLKEIEKSLQTADLGASPIIRDDLIMINIPPMTEEARKEIVKKLNHKVEEARVSLRNQREKAKEAILAMEKNKEIAEDEKYRLLEDLDEEVKKYNEEIKGLGQKKEQEIMSI